MLYTNSIIFYKIIMKWSIQNNLTLIKYKDKVWSNIKEIILKTKGRRVGIGISHKVIPLFRFIKFIILEKRKGSENILVERVIWDEISKLN